VIRTDHWRICHSFDASLPGWLVAVPLRHVVAIDELTEDEAAELGPLVRNLSSALRAVVGCEKTYVVQFAEAKDFAHVHFHVVPRMPWFTDEQRGPNIFTFLGAPESNRVPTAEMDRIALAVRGELAKP